jgi:hypothetical protein
MKPLFHKNQKILTNKIADAMLLKLKAKNAGMNNQTA